jgi:hypothetical protein
MKNNRLISSLCSVLLLAVCVYAPAGSAAGEKITVMNPAISTKFAKRLPLSPRLDTVEGKTIYLIDNQWGGPEGAYQLLEEMHNWFTEHKPGVKTVLRRTKGNMFTDDPELWQEISEKGDAAILGVGQ